MGQKVNPHGLRVGVIKDWDSHWFVEKKDFASNIKEDSEIRKVLKKKYYFFFIPVHWTQSASHHCASPAVFRSPWDRR